MCTLSCMCVDVCACVRMCVCACVCVCLCVLCCGPHLALLQPSFKFTKHNPDFVDNYSDGTNTDDYDTEYDDDYNYDRD